MHVRTTAFNQHDIKRLKQGNKIIHAGLMTQYLMNKDDMPCNDLQKKVPRVELLC